MYEPRETWGTHRIALGAALYRAKVRGVRQAVLREDGRDDCGPYRWRIVDAEVAEPCS